MGDQFHSNGGEQNIAQGQNAIGKQENSTQPVSGDGNIFSGTGNVTVNGIPPELFTQYVRDLGVTDSALASFFKILEEQQIPRGDLDSKLREIAFRYKELLLRFEAVTSDDPQVQALKEQARQAIENGEYDRADALLNQAKERDRAAVATLKASLAEQQAALEKRQLSEAQSCVDQAVLQRLQYRYEKAAQYWQEAAAALPEGYEWDRAECLGAAGHDLYCSALYSEAMQYCQQSLSIFRAIDDREQEAKLLNNISLICEAQGNYGDALDSLKQGLAISQEIGDIEGQGTAMNNIGTIYHAKGKYAQAFAYIEQSLDRRQEIGDIEGVGDTLISIGRIYDAQGDYGIALSHYEQALNISQELKDKRLESISLDNISNVYFIQENYDAALEYTKQSLLINQYINDRRGEGVVLNNLAMIYQVQEDDARALPCYKQSLTIAKEIGAKAEEAGGNWNIGWIYAKQGELTKAELHLSRAVELATQLERPDLEDWQKRLEQFRAKLRERQ